LFQGRSLELELTADVPSPTQRKRKRQLAFADAETQIPKNKMKQHMTTGKDTCENFVCSFIISPLFKYFSLNLFVSLTIITS
jgi:hypothetical protein